MANIHMVREHTLGLDGAREVARGWAREVEDKLGMSCSFETSRDGDRVHFERMGASGTLRVTPGRFELDARLGMLVGPFKDRIEAGITKYLDEMLPAIPPPKVPKPGRKSRSA